MDIQSLNKELGNIDIYLLDQILKGKVPKNAKILDAGCGEGRNLKYFLNNQYDVFGIDHNRDAIRMIQFILRSNYPGVQKENFQIGELNNLPYVDKMFDYVICSAVLHFVDSHDHFWELISELTRVIKLNGILFIRMTSDIGLNGHKQLNKKGNFQLPDGSIRYLLTKDNISRLMLKFGFDEIEPIKTVIVENARCMTTLVLVKN